ncbi:MAG TPA: LTA synthase family protein [Pirellulales bacterium]|nr:LTA synthase family protein [Pirellulales bacterium]
MLKQPTTTSVPATALGDAEQSQVSGGIAARTRASLREFGNFCASQPMWLATMTLFVLTWTIELYVVQDVTLIYPNETTLRFAFWAPKIRLALDLLFVTCLTLCLRRRWLAVLVILGYFAYLGLLTYFHYFQRPLSMLTIFGNWREGVQLSGFALNLIPLQAAVMLALALACELGALVLSRGASMPRRGGLIAGALVGTAYCGLYLVTLGLDPLDAVQTTRGVGRLGEIRGYMGPWFAEWYYLRDNKVLEQALEYRKVKYDRLAPIEADIPIHKHLVILQAESLDYNVLGYKVDGTIEVTPFLNALRKRSMFYRVTAMHFNGSSDADFAALNAVSGSRHENTYLIPGYPYENTTPQALARVGFETYSFHGNSGEFYSRRGAFEQMGFAGLVFQEELERDYAAKSDRWGVKDADVLAVSAQKMRTAHSPTCHFVITLTTHVPYNQLPASEFQIFPRPRTIVENYLNNMRYLDNCLREYVTALGSGTTIVIYADHPTEEGDSDFSPDRANGREFIPCFIYDSDDDLSKLQKTRKLAAARDGTLNLVDVINYVRHQVERQFNVSNEPSQEHAEPVTR